MTASDRIIESPGNTAILPHRVSLVRWATASVAPLLIAMATGCSTLPSARGLDLMNPSASLLFPGSAKNASPYEMLDGTVPTTAFSGDAGMTEEAYHKIREAKAQNAIVLQVAEDEQPVRVLPLPPGQKSVFVSELLTQTGVLRKLGGVQATLYRPSPDSISGVRMEIQFADDGTVDPTTDYGLRPGDRVQIQKKTTTAIESLVNMALRR
ncbi:hypothetical protein Enr13x_64300 [Stieleria neptunia]|uniref:Uncharacterized protein n=1 Tax=Stieleria neptunia TaxID=2527979 RepID=A0A518I081_9BACT|nr:hypothetical protein [Stieleria neptunia]QDV46521.1 hypothetical protein Enr13x_64300 [Stieleria neptunia]